MKKSDKLCVLCPTRERSHLLKRMLDSYKKNSVQSDIYFAFEGQDPDVEKNIEIIGNKYKDKYWLLGDIGFANKVNILCEEYPGYAAYMILNDDQIIHTKGWDKLLVDKLNKLEKEHGHRLWILHWKDGINDGNLCQSFLTDEMKKIMGSYYPKRLMRHLYTDNMYHLIGESCNILCYMPEIFIEHLHVCKNPALMDDNYKKTQNQESYQRDNGFYATWLKSSCIPACNQILLRTMKDKKKIPLILSKVKKKIEKILAPKK